MNEKRPRKSFEAETKALCKLLDKKRIRKAQKNQKSKENYKNLLKKLRKNQSNIILYRWLCKTKVMANGPEKLLKEISGTKKFKVDSFHIKTKNQRNRNHQIL